MYLVTVEDKNGMWWCDPVAADTQEEALTISERDCARVPEGYSRCLYNCFLVRTSGEVEISPEVLPPSH